MITLTLLQKSTLSLSHFHGTFSESIRNLVNLKDASIECDCCTTCCNAGDQICYLLKLIIDDFYFSGHCCCFS